MGNNMISCPFCGKSIVSSSNTCMYCKKQINRYGNDSIQYQQSANQQPNNIYGQQPYNQQVSQNGTGQLYGQQPYSQQVPPNGTGHLYNQNPQGYNRNLGMERGQVQRVGYSGMSVAAFILSILGCTTIIGFILAMIDTGKNDGTKKTLSHAAIVISIVWFVLGWGLYSYLGKDSTDDKNNKTAVVSGEDKSSNKKDTKTTEAKTEAEEDDGVTIGMKNALKSAESYLRSSAFSREGLIDQLEFEKYSEEEAIYAVDNCEADWNEQAVECAKSYLNSSAFSYTGLIEQLEFEKFTTEEATYGVDNCEADWNEQAVECAKSYLKSGSFSRQGLIDQLVFEGFTQEQAEYGVSQNGY